MFEKNDILVINSKSVYTDMSGIDYMDYSIERAVPGEAHRTSYRVIRVIHQDPEADAQILQVQGLIDGVDSGVRRCKSIVHGKVVYTMSSKGLVTRKKLHGLYDAIGYDMSKGYPRIFAFQ